MSEMAEQKYIIAPQYLTKPSKRRSGRLISPSVKFVVAHDTGNPRSTASGNVKYYESSRDTESASAHIFVDDKSIIECIPALTGPQPEKAWHVLYNTPIDNHLYGYDANDVAIGVEYCYGDNIDADEAYRKYIWVIACICKTFALDPKTSVVGHCILDPTRKTDPVTGLAHSRRSYDQLLSDIATEYQACYGAPTGLVQWQVLGTPGSVRTAVSLNIRAGAPTRMARVHQVVQANTTLSYVGYVVDGEPVNNNARWYRDGNGNYFWSGATLPAMP